jgi:tellurite resistance protein TerC
MLALLVIETTDVLFAVDSIPAVLAITDEAFLVFTSNIFAILCLRSMYFALAGMIARFRYLKYSLVVLLGFIGVKLLLTHHYQVPILTSLFLIIAILTTGIAASILITKKTEPPAITPPKIKIPEPDKSTSKNQTIAAGK